MLTGDSVNIDFSKFNKPNYDVNEKENELYNIKAWNYNDNAFNIKLFE